MKAPEKIKIGKYNITSDGDVIFGWVTNTPDCEAIQHDVEYIRADAFINKASQWINNNLAKYSELTDEDEYGNKLNETVMNVFYGQAVKDFKAYMKGE